MLRRLVIVALLSSLAAAAHPPSGYAQKSTPAVLSLAAAMLPGDAVPAAFGVYLGHGLVLTNWHPWTLDGAQYMADPPAIAPSRQVPRFDDDGVLDPGEDLLALADCGGVWTPLAKAGPGCTPFARFAGAGFVFPLAGDTWESAPVPIQRLVYASRRYDIALFAVDALAVEARGVLPARLSLVPTGIDHPALAAVQTSGVPAIAPVMLRTSAPDLLPAAGNPALGGPWRVPSLLLDSPDLLPAGSPVYDRDSGDLVGLAWRAGGSKTQPETWVSPAALWIQDLYAANESIRSEALAVVLRGAESAPVEGMPTLDDPLAPGLGNSGIDVLHYTLDLAINPDQGTLAGSAALDIRATYQGLITFSLDAAALEIERVTIDGTDTPFVAKEQKLIIQLPAPLDYGATFQVVIAYHAAPRPFASRYMPYYQIGMVFDGGRVSALNEPDAAHSWFPCNDHPTDRATYDFRLRVPAPLEAVANGQLIDVTPHDDGSQTFHWRLAYPMTTYLALVAAADYAAVTATAPNGIPLQNFVYAQDAIAGSAVFSYTGEALVMLEQWFGPYPFDSYGHVVVPREGMALETQTMTAMPDSVLSMSEEDLFALLVHELAHQWYGNTVSLQGWENIWLNEGFATYAEWLAREARYGESSALAARTLSEQALISDKRSTPLAAPQPGELFSTASYDKGAWVLYMLRQQIGDDAFFTLLRTYAATYADRPTTTLDFWQLAESVSGQDLAWFFDQWLLQAGGIPRFTLYWTETAAGADVLLCATQPGDYRLTLPLRFAQDTQTADAGLPVDGSQARGSFALSFAPATLTPDPDQAVLAQVQVQPIAALPNACPPPVLPQ